MSDWKFEGITESIQKPDGRYYKVKWVRYIWQHEDTLQTLQQLIQRCLQPPSAPSNYHNPSYTKQLESFDISPLTEAVDGEDPESAEIEQPNDVIEKQNESINSDHDTTVDNESSEENRTCSDSCDEENETHESSDTITKGLLCGQEKSDENHEQPTSLYEVNHGDDEKEFGGEELQSNDAANNEVSDDCEVVSMTHNTNTVIASVAREPVTREQSVQENTNQQVGCLNEAPTLSEIQPSIIKDTLCFTKSVTNHTDLPIRDHKRDCAIDNTVIKSQVTSYFTKSTSQPSNINCVELQTVSTGEIQNQDLILGSDKINLSETVSCTKRKTRPSTESIPEPSIVALSHPQRIVKGEKGFQCHDCGKYFTRKTSLERHYRVHTGEKPFKCEICGKQYSQKSVLQRHLVTHDVLKPYQCQLCQKMFSEKTALRRHYETHSQAKPHKCHLCGKAFGLKEYLSKHMFLHKGLKPYECKVCEKSFADSSAYKRHCLTHDESKVKLLCSSCNKTFKTQRTLKIHQQKCQQHMLRNLQTT